WEDRDGRDVVAPTDGYLIVGTPTAATWLPEDWSLIVYPTALDAPRLAKWFDYALEMTQEQGLPGGNDLGSSGDQTPRAFVRHAHLIARHLRVRDCPFEPRQALDLAGYLTELHDIRGRVLRELADPPDRLSIDLESNSLTLDRVPHSNLDPVGLRIVK